MNTNSNDPSINPSMRPNFQHQQHNQSHMHQSLNQQFNNLNVNQQDPMQQPLSPKSNQRRVFLDQQALSSNLPPQGYNSVQRPAQVGFNPNQQLNSNLPRPPFNQLNQQHAQLQPQSPQQQFNQQQFSQFQNQNSAVPQFHNTGQLQNAGTQNPTQGVPQFSHQSQSPGAPQYQNQPQQFQPPSVPQFGQQQPQPPYRQPSGNFQQQPPPGFQPRPGFGLQQPAPFQSQMSNASFASSASGLSTPRMSVSGDTQRKIDPDMIPSPITVMQLDSETHGDKVWGTLNKSVNPPLTSTNFKTFDEGNAGPKYIRMTTYHIASTDELAKTSAIPIGLLIQPLADQLPGEMPIPVVDSGKLGPIRCSRCQGYINPFCMFIKGGRVFVCNLCQMENTVPNEYMCNLDLSGRRQDINQRPELQYGTVDWVATENGMLVKAVEAILELLYGEPNQGTPLSGKGLPPGTKIGIFTFDRSVHFYNLKAGLEQPQMMIVPDINEIFVPLNEGLFVDPQASRNVIEMLLNSLPTMFENNRINEPALGAAAAAAHYAMKENGGKLLVFQTFLPTIGPGALKNREDVKLLGTDKERSLYEPQEYFWKKLGQDFCVAGISCDMFLFPNSYIDIATIGTLSSLTGGSIFNYTNFNAEKDGLKFKNDLHRQLTNTFGYDGLLRVRCSNGLKTVDHFGNFYMRNNTDVELAGIDSNTTIAVSIKHESKLDEKQESSFQVAMLYTNAVGERRVRIHTVSVPCTPMISTLFRFAEMDSTINFLAKAGVAQANNSSLKEVRDQLTEKCCAILGSYRKHCASVSSSGQLILPESLKLYPIYSLALLKNKAFRGGERPEMSTDIRMHSMRFLKSIPVSESIPLIYPRMISLHDIDLESKYGTYNPELGRVVAPPSIRVSMERLQFNGIYLIENGVSMMMWIGRQCTPQVLKQLFDVEVPEQVDIRKHLLPQLETELNKRVRNLIQQFQFERKKYCQLQIVRQQLDPMLELEFSGLLCEDKNFDTMDYVDYLCFVHRSIQLEMQSSG
ncbi:COPII coat Sec23p-Sfb3p heterodimer component [Clydaea vesicula]|uniref:COPII coat Sec23p-Sfb3p heterodimer component n=1 Tax=Clydaea vesicula TaxID=447962 RepID=A0AAD5XSQ0_9FUNG|nr:COPII coat Sec23p-Sfb3p heterodimer component [Clydaea vesicula]